MVGLGEEREEEQGRQRQRRKEEWRRASSSATVSTAVRAPGTNIPNFPNTQKILSEISFMFLFVFALSLFNPLTVY